MRERRPDRKEISRREFLGKALFPIAAFGFLSIVLGRFLPREKHRETERPNLSLKEASHYSKLAG